jgi:hypothetical protein
MGTDRAVVRAFKALFREGRVATVAQVRQAVAPEDVPDLPGWLGAHGLTKYYEVRGEACCRTNAPTPWDRVKKGLKVVGKAALTKAVPLALGIATGAGATAALGALVNDVVHRIRARGLEVPADAVPDLEGLLGGSEGAADALMAKLTRGNSPQGGGADAAAVAAMVKLTIAEEVLPRVTEVQQALELIAAEQGGLRDLLEDWRVDQEGALAELARTQEITREELQANRAFIEDMSQSLGETLHNVDRGVASLLQSATRTQATLTGIELQLTRVFEAVCQGGLADLPVEGLWQASRVQFEAIRLSGKWDEPYDPDLFVGNPALDRCFTEFLRQPGTPQPIFLLLAQMGMGKTWNLVHLAARARGLGLAVPFFVPIHLGFEGILERVFGSSGGPLVQRVGEAAQRVRESHGVKVLLVLDGVDEIVGDRQDFVRFVDQLLTQYGRHLWVAMSCRATDWGQHPQLLAAHPRIAPFIHANGACDPQRDLLRIPTPMSYYLEALTDGQLGAALARYGFDRAQMPPGLLRIVRNPYVLRLLLQWGCYPDPADGDAFTPYFYNRRAPHGTVLYRMGVLGGVDQYLFQLVRLFGDAGAT